MTTFVFGKGDFIDCTHKHPVAAMSYRGSRRVLFEITSGHLMRPPSRCNPCQMCNPITLADKRLSSVWVGPVTPSRCSIVDGVSPAGLNPCGNIQIGDSARRGIVYRTDIQRVYRRPSWLTLALYVRFMINGKKKKRANAV